ncbi:WD domain, G-beta repeat protein (macronuclear) [Tetrahymena thermophila SB210]|uniref:WD domain, G-beta repeat protein n=1 Tax=Tetrahymena thermophila (strain SB210) TaxID=312017 RepID=Q22D01_TETTS|nr:WD domain, G-beta repeat protein [Tetrahymena thermophila SB210]EAR83188.2 WD domain, G-beta repeat protein [Tetrahymena thermophila SB210]|eukprot:XP_001030851.2 WD domain, G-beta repeat protein [Tetrahymena thermophila SB210]
MSKTKKQVIKLKKIKKFIEIPFIQTIEEDLSDDLQMLLEKVDQSKKNETARQHLNKFQVNKKHSLKVSKKLDFNNNQQPVQCQKNKTRKQIIISKQMYAHQKKIEELYTHLFGLQCLFNAVKIQKEEKQNKLQDLILPQNEKIKPKQNLKRIFCQILAQKYQQVKMKAIYEDNNHNKQLILTSKKMLGYKSEQEIDNRTYYINQNEFIFFCQEYFRYIIENQHTIKEKVEFSNKEISHFVSEKSEKFQQRLRVKYQLNWIRISVETRKAFKVQSKRFESLMLRKIKTETHKKGYCQEKKQCFEVKQRRSINKEQKINDTNKVQRNHLNNLVLKNKMDQFNNKLTSLAYKHKLRQNNEKNQKFLLIQSKEKTKSLISSFDSENQQRVKQQLSLNYSLAKIINTDFDSLEYFASDSQKSLNNHSQKLKIKNIQEEPFKKNCTNNKSQQQLNNCQQQVGSQLLQVQKLSLQDNSKLKSNSEFGKLRNILKVKEDKLLGGGICGSRQRVGTSNIVQIQKQKQNLQQIIHEKDKLEQDFQVQNSEEQQQIEDDEITFKEFNKQYKKYINDDQISEKIIEGHVRKIIEKSLYEYREYIIQVDIRHKVIDMINLLINYFLIIRQSKSTQSIQSDINLINSKLETLIIYCKENKERHPCLDLYQYFDILKTLNGQRQGLDEINKSVAAQIISKVIQVAKFGAGFVSIAGAIQNFTNINLSEIDTFIKEIKLIVQKLTIESQTDFVKIGLESYSDYNSNNIANNMQALWLRKVQYLGDNLSQQDPIQEIMFYLEESPKIVNKDTQLFVYMQLNYLLSKQQIEDNFQKISKIFEDKQKQELITQLSDILQVKEYSESILDKIKMIANLIAQNNQFRYIKAQLLLYFAQIIQNTNQNSFTEIMTTIISNYLSEKQKSVKIIYKNNQIIADFIHNRLNKTQILVETNQFKRQMTKYLDNKQEYNNFAYEILNEKDLDKQLAKYFVELWEQSVQQRQKRLEITHKDDVLLEAIHLYVNQQITYQEGYKINTEGRDAVKQIIEQFLIPNFVFSSDDSQNKEESQQNQEKVNQNNCKIISILAEGGSGKSMLLKKLEVELLNRDSEYTRDTRSDFIPFIIKCNSLDRKQPSLEDYLESVKIKRKDIDMLKNSERNKLIMLDGYDEYTGEYFKVYEKLKLNEWVNTLVIVTSRLEKITISDAKKYFNYYDNQGKQAKNNNSFGIFKLEKITDKDIEDYLEKYKKYSENKKDFNINQHNSIKDIILKNKQLNKLLTLPINLYLTTRMIADIDIIDQKVSKALQKVSDQIEIQEFFFQQQFKSQSQIYIKDQQNLNLNEKQKQELIEKVQLCYFEYFQLIAMQMFIQKGEKSNYLSTTKESIKFQPSQDASVLFKKCNLKIDSLIKKIANYVDSRVITRINLDLDAENTNHKSQNNKKKDQENNKCQEFEFRHKSLFEYFAARAMKYDFDIHGENIYKLDIKQLKEFNINKRIVMSNQSEQQILIKLYKLMQSDIYSSFFENNYSEEDISKTNKYIQFIKKSTISKSTEKSQIDVGASNLLSALYLSKFSFTDLTFKKCSFSQAYIFTQESRLTEFKDCNLSHSYIHNQNLDNYETSNTKNAALGGFQKQFGTDDIYSFKQVIFYKNTLVSITRTGYINQFEISHNKNQPCKKLQSKKITHSDLQSIHYVSIKNIFIIRAFRSIFEINTQTFETINTFTFDFRISSLAINNSKYLITLKTEQIFYGDIQNGFILLDESKIQAKQCFMLNNSIIAFQNKEINIYNLADLQIIKNVKNDIQNMHLFSFTSEYKYLAIGFEDQTCQIWSAENGFEVIKTTKEHRLTINTLAFSSKGKYLATSSSDKTCIFQNLEREFQLIKTIDERQNKIVNSIVFSEDGKYFAIGSKDNTCKIFNVENNFEYINTIEAHSDSISSVAFSADGKYLATGSYDNTCRIWIVQNELQMIDTVLEHTDKISSVAFSPDSKYLATGSLDNTCKIWDLHKLQHVQTIGEHTSGICQVAFSPDNKYLATVYQDDTCKIWDVENKFKFVNSIQTGLTCQVAFSADGNYLATSAYDHSIFIVNIWNIKNGFEHLKKIETDHADQIISLAFSADGQYLASGSQDRTCKVWNVENGFEQVITIQGHTDRISSILFSPDSKYLATGSFDNTCQIWNVEEKFQIFNGIQVCDDVLSIAFSVDGKYLATGSEDNTCILWNLDYEFKLNISLINDNYFHEQIFSLCFSPDNKYLATTHTNNKCKIWNLENGFELIYTIEGHDIFISSITFSSDAKYLATGSGDFTCKIWKVENGFELIKVIDGHTYQFESIAFSIDGKYLATGSNDKTCKIWNIQNGFKLIKTVEGFEKGICSVVFSANCQYLATASLDCKIWNIENSFQLLKTIEGKDYDYFYKVNFSSDGRLLLTISKYQSCKIWNVENGFQLIDSIEEDYLINSVDFSADSKYLVICPRFKNFKIWNVENKFQFIYQMDKKIDYQFFDLAAISKDCKYLATTNCNTINIWNFEKGLKLLNKNETQNKEIQANSSQKNQNIKIVFSLVYIV